MFWKEEPSAILVARSTRSAVHRTLDWLFSSNAAATAKAQKVIKAANKVSPIQVSDQITGWDVLLHHVEISKQATDRIQDEIFFFFSV